MENYTCRVATLPKTKKSSVYFKLEMLDTKETFNVVAFFKDLDSEFKDRILGLIVGEEFQFRGKKKFNNYFGNDEIIIEGKIQDAKKEMTLEEVLSETWFEFQEHIPMPDAKKYSIPANHLFFQKKAPGRTTFWSDGIHLWFEKGGPKSRLSQVFVDHWNRNHFSDAWIHFITDEVLKKWTDHNDKLGPMNENAIKGSGMEEQESLPEGMEIF
jgi:hypothetical protein